MVWTAVLLDGPAVTPDEAPALEDAACCRWYADRVVAGIASLDSAELPRMANFPMSEEGVLYLDIGNAPA